MIDDAETTFVGGNPSEHPSPLPEDYQDDIWLPIRAPSSYFDCVCHSPEHTLRIFVDPDDGMVSMSTFLNHYQSWWKRFVAGIKYIFGHRSKFGHWDYFELDPKDLPRFRNMIEFYDSPEMKLRRQQLGYEK